MHLRFSVRFFPCTGGHAHPSSQAGTFPLRLLSGTSCHFLTQTAQTALSLICGDAFSGAASRLEFPDFSAETNVRSCSRQQIWWPLNLNCQRSIIAFFWKKRKVCNLGALREFVFEICLSCWDSSLSHWFGYICRPWFRDADPALALAWGGVLPAAQTTQTITTSLLMIWAFGHSWKVESSSALVSSLSFISASPGCFCHSALEGHARSLTLVSTAP